MFELQWYGMLLLLPLPLVARWWLKPTLIVDKQPQALHVPFINDFQQAFTPAKNNPKQRRLLFFLALLAWLFFVVALTKPVWLGDAVNLPINARNILLAIDLSGSMQERDFTLKGRNISRLAATKKVAIDFINRRAGDRIGLILFGDQAYLQTPLTHDRKTVEKLLSEATLGLAGERTALGDAIGLAIKRVKKSSNQSYVLVLMTDGAATAGVDVREAANIAAMTGLKIYTVGIGSAATNTVTHHTALDEKTLQHIAQITGGLYFRARTIKEFDAIYQQLDTLEPVVSKTEQWRPRYDLFHWPLAIAVLFIILLASLRMVWINSV
ncbi:MAG TPA: VWA domain-containing protein [Thiothrix sp.]|nr:VWA domain-containing protein [Thiothrix sp.]